MNRPVRLPRLAALLSLALLVVTTAGPASASSIAPRPQRPAVATSADWTVARLTAPARTEVRDTAGVLVAELTDGARTVPMAGPSRRWGETGLATSITSDRWVRLLPAPFDGSFDPADADWLASAMADGSPDLLAIAFQYAPLAPEVWREGMRVAGDARYGPAAGADFNDYLGVPWSYGGSIDAAEAAEVRSLDCSGFVRMVFGYRSGVRMSIGPAAGTLPRRAADQLASGPGRVVVANAGRKVASMVSMRAGDLVFFDASTRDGTAIDHVGIFVGADAAGHARFISSRTTADGPTIGDLGGASILDGTGYWASAFRAVRRP
jgi:hypothetical protein